MRFYFIYFFNEPREECKPHLSNQKASGEQQFQELNSRKIIIVNFGSITNKSDMFSDQIKDCRYFNDFKNFSKGQRQYFDNLVLNGFNTPIRGGGLGSVIYSEIFTRKTSVNC